MNTYTVTMWLTCKSADPDILKAFDERWTPALQRKWTMMAVSAADTNDLAVALNAEIYTSCGAQMAADISLPLGTGFDGVDAFKAADWSVGSGGLHETGSPVAIIATKNGVSKKPWTFPADHSKQGTMYADCVWKQVQVLSSKGLFGTRASGKRA